MLVLIIRIRKQILTIKIKKKWTIFMMTQKKQLQQVV
jgi:hypothetical protein